MNKRYLLLFLLLMPALSFAQTAAEIDAVLEMDSVSAAVAARFVLGAAGILPPELSSVKAEEAAYDEASSRKWLMVQAEDSITLKDTAFLIMKAFEIKGGVMYSLFKNPRYAYREMVYHKLITGDFNQTMKVSGTRLLQMLDKTMSYAGEYDGGVK